jgi:CRP-like cAMP-binding protein
MDFIYTALAETNVFQGLTAGEVADLLDGRPVKIKEYSRDEYVAYAGDTCFDMLFVIKGSVRGEMSDFSGKTLKIEDIVAPRPLAAGFVFGKNNRFPVNIITNEPSTILTLPRDVLIYTLQNSRTVLQNYLNTISSRTQFLSNKIHFLSFKTIKEKIAHYLLSHLPKNSPLIVMKQTQNELADFFGVTRPSLARAIAELEAEGILHAERKEITILDKEKLNKLLNY